MDLKKNIQKLKEISVLVNLIFMIVSIVACVLAIMQHVEINKVNSDMNQISRTYSDFNEKILLFDGELKSVSDHFKSINDKIINNNKTILELEADLNKTKGRLDYLYTYDRNLALISTLINRYDLINENTTLENRIKQKKLIKAMFDYYPVNTLTDMIDKGIKIKIYSTNQDLAHKILNGLKNNYGFYNIEVVINDDINFINEIQYRYLVEKKQIEGIIDVVQSYAEENPFNIKEIINENEIEADIVIFIE